MTVTEEQIRKALDTLFRARQKTAGNLGLCDPKDPSQALVFPPLPPPACGESVRELEKMTGRRLPPSYKYFLDIYNGIPKFDIGSDLLSIDETLDLAQQNYLQDFDEMLAVIERKSADGLLVIGVTSSKRPRFLYDYKKVDAGGEWTIVEYGERDELYDEYADFLEFLRDVTKTVRLSGKC